jgi:hypothetical protein
MPPPTIDVINGVDLGQPAAATITVDIDAELAQLDPTGHRPLRQPVMATAS